MRKMASFRFVLPLLLSGCLTSTHVIPPGELQRLASLPPEERGRQVRVVQGFAGSEAPPEHAPSVGVSTVVVVTPTPSPYRYGYGYGGVVRQSAKSMAEESKWWLVIAAVTAVGLAVTEGLRFDGWAELHPMHPIHIWGADGQWTWVPLAQLDAGTAAWARKAFVREEEGPFRRLARAPLDRVGFTYSLLMGSGEVTAFDDTKRAGFLAHIQFGYFPVQQLGLLFDIGLGWRTDRDYTDIFQSRYAFELQGFPLDLGALHLGAFGQLGLAHHFEDFPDGFGEDRTRLLISGGGIAQLELTTRLAITVRAGVAALGDESAAEITAGVSIY